MASKGSKTKAGGIFVDLRMGVANLQKDTRSATKVLKSLEKDITNIGKNLSVGFKLAGTLAGVYAIDKLKDSLVNLAEQGDRASSIEDNFKKLGGIGLDINKASEAALGLVSSFDLMAIANKGLVANVQGFKENFGQLAEFSTRLADSLGVDVKQKLEEVSQAFVTGKEKGLAQLGFIIDADKAYKDFAKTNGLLIKEMTSSEKRAAIQAQAFSQLTDVTNKLAPASKGVADAYTALNVKISDSKIQIGQSIDANDDLKKAFEDLAAKMSNINWREVGNDVAYLASIFTKVLGVAIEVTADHIDKLARSLKVLDVLPAFGSLSQAQAHVANAEALEERAKKTKAVISAMKELEGIKVFEGNKFVLDKKGLEQGAGATEKLREAIKGLGADGEKYKSTLEAAERTLKNHSGAVQELEDKKSNAASKSKDELVEETKNLRKVGEEISNLKSKWDDFLNKESLDSLKGSIEKSITDLDQNAFNNLTQKLKETVKTGFLKEWEESISKGAVSLEQVSQKADEISNQAVTEYADNFQDKSEEAYKNSIETWQSLFENAITGATFDLESALKQVAVGFAAQMAQAVFGSIGGLDISSPQGIGGSIAQSILSQIGSSAVGGGAGAGSLLESIGLSGAGSILGSAGMTGAQASAAGLAGPSMANGMFASGAGVLGSVGPALPYVAVAAVAAGVIHKNWGSIEKFFGGGSQNPETNARNDYAGKLEDLIKEIGGLSVNKGGKVERLTDIKVGNNSRFNDPNWADSFNKQDSSSVFNALAEGLKGILGIAQNVGGQMGMILSENLGGSVDEARSSVQQLGLSFQDFEKYFLGLAEKGSIRWHDFNVQIAGISEAFKPGLVAVGATKQAYDQLIAAGGKGLNAVIQAKNLAQEGLDLNLENVNQLAEVLKNQGANAEFAQAFAQSAKDRGLGALKAIVAGSNQEIGSLVGGMEAASSKLNQTWADMFAQLDELKGKFEAIPSEIVTKFKVESDIDPNLIRLMDSGGLSGGSIPDISMMANSGLDAIRSSTNKVARSSLKVPTAPATRSLVVNVDARGAQAGVEREVIAAVRRMKSEIIGETMETVANYSRRGRI